MTQQNSFFYNQYLITKSSKHIQKKGKRLKALHYFKNNLYNINTNLKIAIFRLEYMLKLLMIPSKLIQKKIGSTFYQIPVSLVVMKYTSISLNWIITSLNSYSSKFSISIENNKLLKKEGDSWQKRKKLINQLRQTTTIPFNFKTIKYFSKFKNLNKYKIKYFLN